MKDPAFMKNCVKDPAIMKNAPIRNCSTVSLMSAMQNCLKMFLMASFLS